SPSRKRGVGGWAASSINPILFTARPRAGAPGSADSAARPPARTLMNRLLCVFTASLAALLTPPAWADWSDDAFPIKHHDFGTVAVASKTEFRFPIRNTTTRPIHIQSVRASCGCTTATVETPYIEPGQT